MIILMIGKAKAEIKKEKRYYIHKMKSLQNKEGQAIDLGSIRMK